MGMAVDHAMRAIEDENDDLKGILPKGYVQLDNHTLVALLWTFAQIPVDAEENIFGRIYEYFLDRFALAQGPKGGEFFTPNSIVKLIVGIIEPLDGSVLDPACGSGGFFVQSARFVQNHLRNSHDKLMFFGQERIEDIVRLCRMNLTVHGLAGEIQQANSYYENAFNRIGRFDYVMANPPFNARIFDKERLWDDRRYPFGLPRTDNANYLWIQQFYSSLNAYGRAGFVMPNSTSDARGSELDIRHRLIQTRSIDVIVSMGSNFLYTTTLPCTLWFLDKGKQETERRDKVLFIDARQIYKQVDRIHRSFTSDMLEFVANIVRLYRGEAVETIDGSTAKLQEIFPGGTYRDVPGLCKVATLAQIEAQGWSLNPGRYVGGSKQMLAPAIKRTKVFISYCHRDKEHFDRLLVHLAFLEREGRIDIWHDAKIAPGEKWREEIKKAISSAKVAILLVSANFLASKFIAEDELPPLLKAAKAEEAVILPVILSSCAFEDSQLADFQSVNDPSRPFISMNRDKKEKLLNEIAKRVRDVMAK